MLIALALIPIFISAALKRRPEMVTEELALSLALVGENSYLSFEDEATVRFKLDRTTLDALMPLWDDAEVVAAIHSLRSTIDIRAIFSSASQFLIQFMKDTRTELCRLLSIEATWGVTEYPASLLASLKQLLIAHINHFPSLCLVEYLPGAIIKNYRRYFKPVEYPEVTGLAHPPEETGGTYRASVRISAGIWPLSRNILRIFPDRLVDIERKCSVRAFGDCGFFPAHKVHAHGIMHGPLDLFWGLRGHKTFPACKRLTLGASLVNDDVYALSVVRDAQRGLQITSVFSTAAERFIFERSDPLADAPDYNLSGDFLFSLAGTPGRIELSPGGRMVDTAPACTSFSLDGRWKQCQFRHGICSRADSPSLVSHIYDIQPIAQKLRSIVAAIDGFWQIPGVAERVEFLASLWYSRWQLVLDIANRESDRSPLYRDRSCIWPFRVLEEFQSRRFDNMTPDLLHKLLYG
jgi:hypothetical protein